MAPVHRPEPPKTPAKPRGKMTGKTMTFCRSMVEDAREDEMSGLALPHQPAYLTIRVAGTQRSGIKFSPSYTDLSMVLSILNSVRDLGKGLGEAGIPPGVPPIALESVQDESLGLRFVVYSLAVITGLNSVQRTLNEGEPPKTPQVARVVRVLRSVAADNRGGTVQFRTESNGEEPQTSEVRWQDHTPSIDVTGPTMLVGKVASIRGLGGKRKGKGVVVVSTKPWGPVGVYGPISVLHNYRFGQSVSFDGMGTWDGVTYQLLKVECTETQFGRGFEAPPDIEASFFSAEHSREGLLGAAEVDRWISDIRGGEDDA